MATFARAIAPIKPATTTHYATIGQHPANRIRPHTPPPGDSEALAVELQQRAENALSLALHYARIGSHPQALAKARRAIAALSQACTETAGA